MRGRGRGRALNSRWKASRLIPRALERRDNHLRQQRRASCTICATRRKLPVMPKYPICPLSFKHRLRCCSRNGPCRMRRHCSLITANALAKRSFAVRRRTTAFPHLDLPVLGEMVFMPVSAFEKNRGNAVANRTDRVKHTVGPACQTFPMACHRSVTDGTGSHCNKL